MRPRGSCGRAARIAPRATAVVISALALGACGTTDEASRQTLPPLVTTTSSTVPPTTAPEDATRRFYEIKRGDSLASIAAAFGVPVQAIIDLNGIENPDSIPAGETIEIPSGVVMIDQLPDVTTTTVP